MTGKETTNIEEEQQVHVSLVFYHLLVTLHVLCCSLSAVLHENIVSIPYEVTEEHVRQVAGEEHMET